MKLHRNRYQAIRSDAYAKRPFPIAALIAVLLGVALSGSIACAQPSAEDAEARVLTNADFVGVWHAARNFGPELRGTLHLTHSGDRWSAQAGPLQASTMLEPGGTPPHVEIHFPNGAKLRGKPIDDGKRFRGIWIQPMATSITYASAAPLTLERRSAGHWSGPIPTLEDTLNYYIVVTPGDDGALKAFLRNPERNIGRYARIETFRREGNEITLVNRNGNSGMSGTYDPEAGVISMFSYYTGTTFDFVRLEDIRDSGFAPRRDTAPYSYRTPMALDDGWNVAHAQRAGLDASRLEAMVREIATTKTESVSTPYIQALQVSYKGKLVLDEYFHDFHAERPHDTRSAGKSLTSMLVGAGGMHGVDIGLETSAYAAFGDTPEDPRRKAMNVGHLLTMSPGWNCDDDDEDSPGNENNMQNQSEQPDWRRYALDLPMATDPGSKAIYCTAGINLAMGVLERQSGRPIPELFDEWFSEPLQMRGWFMNLDPLEKGYGGGGIMLRPRDKIKLGQVMLDAGRWNGKRVLPEAWVKDSVRAHASIHEEGDYGLAWWRIKFDVEGRQYDAFYSSGNGGQMAIVIPELEVVTSFMAGNYGDYRTWSKFRDVLVPKYVIPAVTAGAKTASRR